MSKKSIIALCIVASALIVGALMAFSGADPIEIVKGVATALVVIILLVLCLPEISNDKYGEQSRKTSPPPLVQAPPVSPSRQVEALSQLNIGKSKFPEGEKVLSLDPINGKGFTERK